MERAPPHFRVSHVSIAFDLFFSKGGHVHVVIVRKRK